jgi:type IV pilus modification protein PilV
MKQHRHISHNTVRQTGFSIMEVLIGIAVFAIGMLALASLQGALTRSTVEAKVRTEAVSIAEEIIEAQRGFSKVLSTPGVFDYGEIRSSNAWENTPLVLTRNNVTFTVTQDVDDYYYDSVNDNFTTTTTGAFSSNYKSVAVTVNWGDDREFVIQEGVDTGDVGATTDENLGGGSIQVSSIISSVSVATIGRVAEETEKPIIAPPVLSPSI